ncbi:MAG: hypothetical protein LC776_16670, partial [Acidobacteria bacterium]|nr:hypothetical protein [Acidobacteriota bacterium]
MTAATGTGYSGVSQLATGIKYRAWGALKTLTNGDVSEKANFALGYDSRLRLTRFDGGGRVTEHDYYADGRVRAVRDFTYGNFDRSYTYDHVGRLSSASAGTSPQWQQNPYSFTYSYDVWGNTTARSGTHWSQRADFTASYANNRNTQ